MKIVQSLWSRPAALHGGYLTYHGRWPHARFFWYSWIISAGWAKRHYEKMELVTDSEGARWLIDRLKLPFTSVRTDLDSLDLPGTFWAAGKLKAYAVQDEPFFHIDGDVYLARRMPPEYERCDVLCQLLETPDSIEDYPRVYDSALAAISGHVPHRPSCWPFMSERVACNCGLFGGANVKAIRRYAETALELLTAPANAEGWRDVDVRSSTNCVVEQSLLWCSMREQDVPITTIFDDADFANPEKLREKALHTGFNHAAVEGKNQYFGQHLEELMEREFPEQYAIIRELYPRVYNDLAMPTTLADDGPREGQPMSRPPPIERVEIIAVKRKPPD